MKLRESIRPGLPFLARLTLAFALSLVMAAGGALALPSSAATLFVRPTSLVSKDGRQRVELEVTCAAVHDGCALEAWKSGELLASATVGSLAAGKNTCHVMLPERDDSPECHWIVKDGGGHVLARSEGVWRQPRHWTIYVLSSSHCDIGLHEPQYVQALMADRFMKEARCLVGEQQGTTDPAAYRYVVEGTWLFNQFMRYSGEKAVKAFVRDCVVPGRIGIGATCAGNVTPVYGMEELCRSAYSRRWLRETFGVTSDSMMMTDFPGLSWGLVEPYVGAGIKNVLWLPNGYVPCPKGYRGPQYPGAGRRLFWWEGPDSASRMLVLVNPGYLGGAFGLPDERAINGAGFASRTPAEVTPESIVPGMVKSLAELEARTPLDVWLAPSFDDNEMPNTRLSAMCRSWNGTFKWPCLKTTGNLSEPFDIIRAKFADKIPVVRGDITAIWSLMNASTPQLAARKAAADAALADGEAMATLASWLSPAFVLDREGIARAWWALICNDEHSYGVSGYKGRRVCETWMQHRDWIETAEATADRAASSASEALFARNGKEPRHLAFFNPTLTPRREIVEIGADGGRRRALSPTVPSFGQTVVGGEALSTLPALSFGAATARPPEISNRFYKVRFSLDGGIESIFDNALGRQFLDTSSPYRCNQFVYTRDFYKTFTSPDNARFSVAADALGTTVRIVMDHAPSGARIEQTVSLPAHEKRIDIEDAFFHVTDLYDRDRNVRFMKYGYFAFPFAVPGGRFHAQLNGPVATPKDDQPDFVPDGWMAARGWSAVENDTFGVALILPDSPMVEFGRMHRDKNERGNPFESTGLYCLLFNDWLQRHVPNGRVISPRYRYSITSYSGTWRGAGVPAMAWRMEHPLRVCRCDAAVGADGKEPARSFISASEQNVRLLAFKRAEDGRGFIVRLQETDGLEKDAVRVNVFLPGNLRFTRCNTIEDDIGKLPEPVVALKPFGTATIRVERERVEPGQGAGMEGRKEDRRGPLAIGSAYTGLIREPRAGHTDSPTSMYLLWGRTDDADFSHYELFRSEKGGFEPTPENKIADVYPETTPESWYQNVRRLIAGYTEEPGGIAGDGEESCFVGRYHDQGLKPATRYHYRVRAVDKKGKKGILSREFSGETIDATSVSRQGQGGAAS